MNNAGITGDLPVEIQPLPAARAVFDVNVFGTLDVTQAFLPLLRTAGGGGRIVNIGSLAGWVALPGQATYAGTKHALEAFSDSLRLELLPVDISVSLIKPGYVKSAIGNKIADSLASNQGLKGHEQYASLLQSEVTRLDTAFRLAPRPQVTTAAIVDAITSAYRKTRYLCGGAGVLPAWLVARIHWLLPNRVWDLGILYVDRWFERLVLDLY